jgi:hypothetical protein
MIPTMARKLLSSTAASHTLGALYVLAQLATYQLRGYHALAQARSS